MNAHQLELPDTRSLKPQTPRQLLEDALRWIEENHGPWMRLVAYAKHDAEFGGRVRVKSYVEALRMHYDVEHAQGPIKLPNALSAPFGRILAAWYPELAPYIPLAHSKLDGLTIPAKPY